MSESTSHRGKPSIEAVGVVVPAHDEVDRIDATMRALAVAARTVGVPVEAVIVLDSCTDGTDDAVRLASAREDALVWHVTTSEFRRASSSRGVGLGVLARALEDRAVGGVAILSTDADTEVPSDWITRHLTHLDAGHDAVAGIVDLNPSDPNPADVDVDYESWWTEYASGFGAGGTHPHVHCANLAVRLGTLLRAGGFGHLSRAEDIDLWKRLSVVGAHLVSDRASVVRTSARSDGRVAGGFATALEQFRPTPPPSDDDRSTDPDASGARLVG